MSIYELRDEIAGALTAAGIRAFPEAPASFSAPGAIVEQGSPYITNGETFGSVNVRFDVFLMVNSSPKWVKEVEAMITPALDALIRAGWAIEGTSLEQFVLTETNSVLMGARITVAAEVALKEMIN